MESTPHDALFRGIFGQPEHMAAELRAVLPPEVLAQLDLATLAPLPATFIDAALAERHADLVFEVALRRGGHALLYVLVEHQSQRDPWMLLRLLGYLLRIWEQWHREHPHRERLPAIVDDLRMQEPGELAVRAMTAVARLALVALQNARDDTEFFRQIGLLANLLREARRSSTGQPSVELVLRYLFELRDRPELCELERRAAAEGVDVMAYNTVSWAEQERRQGRRELLRELCEQRFGALTAEQVATLDSCEGARLEGATRRILSARSFEELFAS